MRRRPLTSTEALFPSAVTLVIVSEFCSLSVVVSLCVRRRLLVVLSATVGKVLTEETTSSSLRGTVGRAQWSTMAGCVLLWFFAAVRLGECTAASLVASLSCEISADGSVVSGSAVRSRHRVVSAVLPGTWCGSLSTWSLSGTEEHLAIEGMKS